jgi:hypothetical protein
MPDNELCDLLRRAAGALDAEAAYLVDVDMDDRGNQRPSVPAADRNYFDALAETAEALRDLLEMTCGRAG